MSADPLFNHVLSSAAQHPCGRPRTAAKEMGGTYVPCIVDFPMKKDGHPLLNKNITYIYIHYNHTYLYLIICYMLYTIQYALYIIYYILLMPNLSKF